MLYLVSTPIGNLSDMTFRAIETLKSCDYILCEDTRHSLILLKHYEIQKPLKSFHKFSEASKENFIIEDLLAGQKIALISDAGTPGISDPGTRLVQTCLDKSIQVIAIPGPCAAITAISCSGLDTDRFQFLGFLPKKSMELERALKEILAYPGTTICYESPNRLIDVLKEIENLSPDRQLVVGRELTKKFEEFQRGTARDLIDYWQSHPLKGEIVLLVSGHHLESQDWETLSPEEHVKYLQETYKIEKNQAIKMAAEIRGVPKRNIYNACLQKPENHCNEDI
jgi:16S rRNA (cytidine1402-2'-O)-methyltransferase